LQRKQWEDERRDLRRQFIQSPTGETKSSRPIRSAITLVSFVTRSPMLGDSRHQENEDKLEGHTATRLSSKLEIAK